MHLGGHLGGHLGRLLGNAAAAAASPIPPARAIRVEIADETAAVVVRDASATVVVEAAGG